MKRLFKNEDSFAFLNDLASSEIIKELGKANKERLLCTDSYNPEYHEALLDCVMNHSIVRNRIENYIPYKMYGFYGKTEIAFVYSDEYLSLETYISEMKSEIRSLLLTVDTDKWSDNFPGAIFLSTWLGFQLKAANKIVVTKYAKKKYPELTTTMLQLYVSIRKYTHYEMELSMSNQEIFNLIDKYTKMVTEVKGPIVNKVKPLKFSWTSLNHLKRIFGYSEEQDVLGEKKKQFIAKNRNSFNYWKKTGACLIKDEIYKSYCDVYKEEFNLSVLEQKQLYEWFMVCKYKGNPKLQDSPELKKLREKILKVTSIVSPVNKVLASAVPHYACLVNEQIKPKDLYTTVFSFSL